MFNPFEDIEISERGRIHLRIGGSVIDMTPAEAAVAADALRQAAQAGDGKLIRNWRPEGMPTIR